MTSYRLLVRGALQIVQVVNQGERVLRGQEAMNSLAVLERSGSDEEEGFSLVVDQQGKIAAIGRDSDISNQFAHAQYDEIIDAKGRCIIPGFVDAHTHAIWAGDRVHEFVTKLAGATYLDIHAAGGGINFTVKHVQSESEDVLYDSFRSYARRMLTAGTTALECKTGYGLTLEAELKMLRVLHRAIRESESDIGGMEVSVTYCAAHAVPKGMTSEEATEDIINVQIPEIKCQIDAGKLTVHNIDVFCEKGVYDVDQTRRILTAGQSIGLSSNFHGEELSCLHSAEMSVDLNVTAISHLEEVSPAGILAMSEAGTVAVLLPTTAFMLRLPSPPARDLISAGVPVALGSDFNPNAHCLAMPVVMHLSCVFLWLTMAEALVAATINAAASLKLADQHGSLEIGKRGDMIILNAPRWEHIIYQLGCHHNVITHVITNGRVSYRHLSDKA